MPETEQLLRFIELHGSDAGCWDASIIGEAYMLLLEQGQLVVRSVAGVGGLRVLKEGHRFLVRALVTPI